ncbi:hypothetical protein [Aliarcobacter butzleri]|uniref:hypothetical protein n=1 Tax=Aliarcobacter butzleri TaxID=28197 RepID=UPI002095E0FA|nr:hypothetical protein [Aliarcobacter butzleri]
MKKNQKIYKSCKKFKLPKYSIKNGFDTFSKLSSSLYKFIKNSKSIFLFFKASIESSVSFIQPSFDGVIKKQDYQKYLSNLS